MAETLHLNANSDKDVRYEDLIPQINALVSGETDTIANLDGAALSATAGSLAEFDTEVPATAVTVGSTDVVLGTTTVANAGDFFVNIDSAHVTHIYQDTDGDKIIEAGEFAVSLTGIQSDTLLAADFTVSGGDLMLMTTLSIIIVI